MMQAQGNGGQVPAQGQTPQMPNGMQMPPNMMMGMPGMPPQNMGFPAYPNQAQGNNAPNKR